MSSYSNYYCSSDVSVFLSSPYGSSEDILLDKLASVGWQENIDSKMIHGLGDTRFKFLSKGNVRVNGVLEFNFIHERYLLSAIRELNGVGRTSQDLEENLEISFSSISVEDIARKKKEIEDAKNREKTGLADINTSFDIKIILNNGFLFQEDTNKQFIIKDVKIVSDTLQCGSFEQGSKPITLQYQFLAKEVKV